MLNDKEKADLDQSTAFIGENLPPLWKRLYQNCIEEEFSKEQSFELLKMYILSNGTAPIFKEPKNQTL
jgi:hypothetical protein